MWFFGQIFYSYILSLQTSAAPIYQNTPKQMSSQVLTCEEDDRAYRVLERLEKNVAQAAFGNDAEVKRAFEEFKNNLADFDPDYLSKHRTQSLLMFTVEDVSQNMKLSMFVQELVNRGANVNMKGMNYRYRFDVSPLGFAMAQVASPDRSDGYWDTVRILLKAGADVDEAERDMRKMLHFEANEVVRLVRNINSRLPQR